MLCTRTNLAIGKRYRSCTYTFFLSQGVDIDLIFTLWAAVSETKAYFQNYPYLGMKLGHWQKFHKLHILCFYAYGVYKSNLFLLDTSSGFRDTGQFSKLPYLGMELGHWQNFQKLHIYPLFLYQRVKMEFIFALRAVNFEIRANFQNCHDI